MRLISTILVLTLLSVQPLSLSLCGKNPRLNVVINAADKLNPDDSGNPLSVVVRIYQLKNGERLERANFDSIWQQDKEVLAEDLLERQERTLLPGSEAVIELKKNPEAKFLGVVALFRKPSGDSWRKIVPVQKSQQVRLRLGEQSVEIVSDKKR